MSGNNKPSSSGNKSRPKGQKSNSNRGNGKSRSRHGKKGGNRKRRGSRGHRGEKLTGFEKVERSYLNLLEKHLEARKKYFDLFHRADPKQLAKVERSFYKAQEELRNYEENMKPEDKEKFLKKYDNLKHDTTYSENHQISPEPKDVPTEGDFEDPHLLPSQKEIEWSKDEEESMGTVEDYQKYKGLE